MPTRMKETIAGTFAEMAKRRSVDKITVKDLVEACGISRQTFYYHFQDITDVIAWMLERRIRQALEAGLQEQDSESALRHLIAAAAENRVLIARLSRSRRREQIEVLTLDAIQAYLTELVRQRGLAPQLHYAGTERLVRFAAYGTSGVILELCSQPEADVDRATAELHQILTEGLLGWSHPRPAAAEDPQETEDENTHE